MRILLVTSEEWNDYVYGNNILTNWFTGFNAEFAQIYTSPGLPINNICDKYFQITDGQMAKSLLGGHRAGKKIFKLKLRDIATARQNAQRKGIYGFMKKISKTFNTPVQLLRDFIWLAGRYDTEELRKFIQNFNPDIVFCPRYVSPKQMRLEKLVSTMTDAPIVAFTADDEASVPKYGSLLNRMRKKVVHTRFSKHISLYSHYFTFSQDQAAEYKSEYGIKTSTLLKCGEFTDKYSPKKVGKPIRLVYAGRLYCNRWKSLAEIGRALQVINKDGIRMVLDIYTQEEMTKEQKTALSEDRFIYMKGCVTPSELKKVYEDADIALHVESLDKKNRLLTRVSFSTKIIDLMASSCAIMAICWEKHAGYQYLKEMDAAFCCSDYQNVFPLLKKICDTSALITEYQKKAYECGIKNHNRNEIHRQIINVFEDVISKKKRNENFSHYPHI